MFITCSPNTIIDNVLVLGPIEYPMYLVQDGNEAVLFEGGVGACGPVLEEHFAQLGLARDSVRQVVVTHGHPDHVMAVPALRILFPGVRVLASGPAAAAMSNEKVVGFFCKMDGLVTEWLLQNGAIQEQHRPAALTERKIPVDVLLEEGNTVAVGGLRFEVLATPGHSDCHLSFFEPARRLLIASDATGFFMPQFGEVWWPGYFTDYGQYMTSMRRLAALNADVLCLSHNAVVTGQADVRSYFAAAIAATEAYHQRIVEAIKAGVAVNELADKLGTEAQARAGRLPLDFFKKSCLLLVNHSLRYEGMEPAKP